MSRRQPWVLTAKDFHLVACEVSPDLLGLAEDGLELREIRKRHTRREGLEALADLRRQVWAGLSDADDAGAAEPEPEPGTAEDDADDMLFIRATELARQTGISREYVGRQCRKGALRSASRKVGNVLYIESDAAEAWRAGRLS